MASERTAGARRWLRRLVPWLITASIIAYLLREYSPSRIAAEIAHGNALAMVPFAVLGSIGGLLLIVGCDTLVFRTAAGRPAYRDVLRGKAASSMLTAVNFGVGHGGYALWVARRTGSDPRTTAGAIFYVLLADLAAVCIIATAVLALAGDALPEAVRGPLATLVPLLGAALVAAPLVGPRILPSRIADPKLLRPWSRVPAATYALTLLGRCANISLLIGATWAASTAFGLEIPVSAMFIYLPAVMIVGALPINVAGFGAVQAAWLLFEPWAPGARILAFQFLWQIMIAAMLILRGLPFLRSVARDIDRRDSGSRDTGRRDRRRGRATSAT